MPVVQSLEDLRQILANNQTIAVVGLSDNPERPAHFIPAYLQQQGYRIIPVNPTLTTDVLGEKVYASLADVPAPIHVVEIFRRPEFIPQIVEEAIAKGAGVVWMQEGIVNEEAARRAADAGLTVVMDACMGETHKYLRSLGQI